MMSAAQSTRKCVVVPDLCTHLSGELGARRNSHNRQRCYELRDHDPRIVKAAIEPYQSAACRFAVTNIGHEKFRHSQVHHRYGAGLQDGAHSYFASPVCGSKYRKSALHQSNDKNSNQCEARCSIIERVRKKTELTFHALLVLAAPRALPPKAARIDCLRVRNRYSPYAEAFSSLEATR